MAENKKRKNQKGKRGEGSQFTYVQKQPQQVSYVPYSQYVKDIKSLVTEFGTKGKPYKEVYDLYHTNSNFGKDIDQFSQLQTVRNEERAVGHKFALQAVPKFDTLPAREKKIILTILECDDFGVQALELGTELAIKYGPQIWKWLKGLWDSSKIGKKTNTFLASPPMQKIQQITRSLTSHADLVCCNYVAMHICPEDVSESRPGTFATKTAPYKIETQYTITGNSSGASGWVGVGPGVSGNNGTSTYYTASLNSNTFNVTTGLDPGATSSSTTQGPLYSNSNLIYNQALYKTSAVTFVPSQSMNNNSGTVQSCLVQQQTFIPQTLGTITQPGIPQSAIVQYPFNQSKSMAEKVRQVYVPCALDASNQLNLVNNVSWLNDLFPSGQMNQFFWFLFSGGNPVAGTVFGTIYFTTQLDFIPAQGVIGLTNLRDSCDAPSTDPFIGTMFKRWRHISCLKLEEAQKLAEIVQKLGDCATYDVVMKEIDAYMAYIPKPLRASAALTINQAQNMDFLEEVKEKEGSVLSFTM